MNIKVVVTNKVELSDGRRGPLMTPFDADIDFVIENLSNGVKFKTGSKFLDIAFLEKVKLNAEKAKKDLESKSEEASTEETKKEEASTEETKKEEVTDTEETTSTETTEETKEEEVTTEETEEVQADGTKNKRRNRNN